MKRLIISLVFAVTIFSSANVALAQDPEPTPSFSSPYDLTSSYELKPTIFDTWFEIEDSLKSPNFVNQVFKTVNTMWSMMVDSYPIETFGVVIGCIVMITWLATVVMRRDPDYYTIEYDPKVGKQYSGGGVSTQSKSKEWTF